MTPFGPECPLCEQPVGNDEESRGVWTEAPRARTDTTRATAPKVEERAMAYGTDDGPGRLDIEVLGKPVDEVVALIKALDSNGLVEYDTSPEVMEVRAVGGEKLELSGPEDGGPRRGSYLDTDVDGDKAGASVRVEPPEPPDPDAVFHEECYDTIFGGGVE